jgi:PHD/YefM family antitoxin component YafN of YafNO toxin-antitoxin module
MAMIKCRKSGIITSQGGLMTYAAMTAIPVTDLRTKQPEIFDNLKESPVLLTRQGHGAGVLVHPDTWNHLIDDLKHYKRMARIERARREMDAGNYFTKQQVQAMLQADGLLP